VTVAATIGLVLDCADPDELARFWSEAIGYTTIGGAGKYVMLVDADGVKPKLLLQAVPEPKTAKNRMHLDIDTADVEGEVARLEALGAQRLEAGVRSEHGTHWVIMADPEGNEFCVCDGGTGGADGPG
jgi:predicted enzyme related to lactoylglutathione lyase